MQDLASLNLLMDKAAEVVGSDYKLAQALGTDRQIISNWRHGRRTATPEDQALIAAVAGLDPITTLARATVAKHEGTAKGDMLMRALGKALLVTGAGLASAGASAHQIYGSTSESLAHLIRCILC